MQSLNIHCLKLVKGREWLRLTCTCLRLMQWRPIMPVFYCSIGQFASLTSEREWRAFGNAITRIASSSGTPLVANVHDVCSQPISGSRVSAKSTLLAVKRSVRGVMTAAYSSVSTAARSVSEKRIIFLSTIRIFLDTIVVAQFLLSKVN